MHEDVHEWEHRPGLRFPRKHSAGKYMSFIQYAAYIKWRQPLGISCSSYLRVFP